MKKLIRFVVIYCIISISFSCVSNPNIENENGKFDKCSNLQATVAPSKNYWLKDNPTVEPFDVMPVDNRRMLVIAGDTLSLLSSSCNKIWSWSIPSGAPINDLPIIDSTQTIYVIGSDITWAAIDLNTGEYKWEDTAVGGLVYKQIVKYNKNQYLILADLSHYRDRDPSAQPVDVPDRLYLCEGTKILSSTDFPVGAKLKVVNNNVFAIIKKTGIVKMQTIDISIK